MRSTSSLAVLVVLGVAAGCSRDKPAANPRLDLVLGDNARGTPVVSALELGGEAKATPAARTSSSGVVANVRATHRARTRHVASVPRPRRAPEPEPMAAPAPQPVAAAPAPTPAADPAAAPANRPDPDPAPEPGRPGRGGWQAPTDGGGVRFPGLPGIGGGVIIIRGGHSGMDPCDEHDRGGMGGMIPRLPTGIGRGFPGGGIRFLINR